MKGVKHYTEDGEYTGKTHKMDGEVHTGAKHSKNSRVVSHSPDGPFKMKGYSYPGESPMKCWKTHERVPGTVEGAKKSCRHKNPAKRPK